MTETTDNQNELFDIVDENDQVIGQAKRREVHNGSHKLHRSIGVVIFNTSGQIFLQQRSATKDTDPLKWTISCSGHVISGFTYEETVLRELKEELGIDVLIEFVDRYVCRAPKETEFNTLYKTIFDGPFQLKSDEIIQGKFFTQKELERQLKSGQIELSFMGKLALKKLGWI